MKSGSGMNFVANSTIKGSVSKSCFKFGIVGVFFLLLLPSFSYAGWVQKFEDGSKTLVSDQKMKFVEADAQNSYLVFDFKTDQITMVDGRRKVYATGPIDAYCQLMNQMLQAFGEMGDVFGKDEEDSGPPTVKVVAQGKETIAGISANKYKVLADGELYEEVWLDEDSGVIKEIGDAWKQDRLQDCFNPSNDPVENSKAYRALYEKGWELQNISYAFGEKEYNTRTIALEKKSIPDSEFKAPDSYQKIKFEDFFQGME